MAADGAELSLPLIPRLVGKGALRRAGDRPPTPGASALAPVGCAGQRRGLGGRLRPGGPERREREALPRPPGPDPARLE